MLLKIFLEKRKRNQTYKMLDYIYPNISYINFLSKDSFNLLKYFLYSKNIKEEQISIFIIKILSNFDENIYKKLIDFNFINILEFENFSDNKIIKSSFNKEILNFLEKIINFCLIKYKVPIITNEILLLGILENEALQNFNLKKNLNFYSLKYNILKTIHNNKIYTKNNLEKNILYFNYLLKLELNNEEFDTFINNLDNNIINFNFRNLLIKNILNYNIIDKIIIDIFNELKLLNKRKYSDKK